MTKKLRDIMSAAPVYMAPGQSALAAARAMKRHATGTVLVLADGELRGLVTDRDIAVRVLAENRDPRTTLIGDLCGGEVATLGPDDNLDDARQLVRERPEARRSGLPTKRLPPHTRIARGHADDLSNGTHLQDRLERQ